MSLNDEPCDGCGNRATHALCDACCNDDIDRLTKERDEARAELKAMKARPAESEIGRLDVMWQELVRERDDAKLELTIAKSFHDIAVNQRDGANYLLTEVERERDEARSEVKRITHNIAQTERYAQILEQENSRLRGLLNRILGDNGPDLSAYLDGHVEAPNVPALLAQREKLIEGLKEGDARCAALLGDLESAHEELSEATKREQNVCF